MARAPKARMGTPVLNEFLAVNCLPDGNYSGHMENTLLFRPFRAASRWILTQGGTRSSLALGWLVWRLWRRGIFRPTACYKPAQGNALGRLLCVDSALKGRNYDTLWYDLNIYAR